MALTPVCTFNTHAQRLYNIFPIIFETTIQASNENSKIAPQSPSKIFSIDTKISSFFNNQKPLPLVNVTKQHCLLLTMGRALAPYHEEMYLSSPIYRLDALKNYANCLIWCTWDCNESLI